MLFFIKVLFSKLELTFFKDCRSQGHKSVAGLSLVRGEEVSKTLEKRC